MTSSPGVSTLNLYQRLVAVQRAVPYLKKENSGHQFQYVSNSQTLGAIREAMDANGLILAVRVTNHHLIDKWSHAGTERDGKEGAKEHLTELDVCFTWINSDDPEQRLECPFYGQGLDTGEKGVGKALTYAEKYFLLKFFHIPTDKDDPDAFQERTEAARPKEPPIGDPGFDKLVALTAKVAETIGRDRKQLWGEVLQVAREAGNEQVRALTAAQAAQVEAWLKAQEPEEAPDIFDGGADAARLPIPQGGE
jgi:hypothetical protein